MTHDSLAAGSRDSAASTFEHGLRQSSGTAEGETEARRDLADAHRLAVIYGWSDFIYNHISLRLPDDPRFFLLKRHSILFEDVTAANLAKLDMRGRAYSEADDVNAAGFVIHGGILRARDDINCVVHTHTVAGAAVAAAADGLLPISQVALRFYNRLSFHDYEGLSDDADECARLTRDLGTNKAMILRNHGLITCGAGIAEAISLMRSLVTACEIQTTALAMGRELTLLSHDVAEHTARQWENYSGAAVEMAAYRRAATKRWP